MLSLTSPVVSNAHIYKCQVSFFHLILLTLNVLYRMSFTKQIKIKQWVSASTYSSNSCSSLKSLDEDTMEKLFEDLQQGQLTLHNHSLSCKGNDLQWSSEGNSTQFTTCTKGITPRFHHGSFFHRGFTFKSTGSKDTTCTMGGQLGYSTLQIREEQETEIHFPQKLCPCGLKFMSSLGFSKMFWTTYVWYQSLTKAL